MHEHRHGRLWRHHTTWNSKRQSHPFSPSSLLFMGFSLGLSRCPLAFWQVPYGRFPSLKIVFVSRRMRHAACHAHARLALAHSIQRSVFHCPSQCMPLCPCFPYVQDFRRIRARCSESIEPKARVLKCRLAFSRRARQLAHATASTTAAPSCTHR